MLCLRSTAVACLLLLAAALSVQAQPARPALTVDTIMQDHETWIGDWPGSPFWSEHGDTLYFRWNPEGAFLSDSLYRVPRSGGTPEKVPPADRRTLGPTFDGWRHGEYVYDADFARKVYARDGDLYLYDRTDRTRTRLTKTQAREQDPRFSPDGAHVVFERDDNLFRLDLATGALAQLTDLRSGTDPEEPTPSEQDAFLEQQQLDLFETLRTEQEEREAAEAARERDAEADAPPPTFYTGDKRIEQLQLDPTGRYVTFALTSDADATPTTLVSYVTESGYAEELTARPKVGAPGDTYELYVQDLQRDTTLQVDLHQLPGAYDVPVFLKEQGAELDSTEAKRHLFAYGPYWSPSGQHAVLEVRARDNKDRWIVRLDPATQDLTVLDRQHDDAWIAGPGISWWGGASTLGWLPDDRHIYFQSEATGYSHLYTADVETGAVTPLTEGDFEVFDPMLSRDGTTWTFVSSEVSPHVRHVYQMPVDGGPRTRLTTMTGNNAYAMAPTEDLLALRYSFTTQPPEIYLKPLAGMEAAPERITHSTTDDWEAYPWRTGEIVRFMASDGVEVPAQLFVPETPNGAAVLFVHGAGYLQNVHRWWSSYFREYMFHNLLTDLGYTVLNVDYRGSAGYGRDWRTAIYRHMGGRDLGDYVDAQRYLEERFDIPPERSFIYGGSYGGFLTLMALFTAPEHFGGGAALRSVTDWAHYNHAYTANILNTPAQDSLAYARSSPIHFAEGLADPLLMAHGLIDTNVQPQDIFRLSQRLIELGKTDWELAMYPVEGHGFTEPSSWTDEYRRILELAGRSVGPEAAAQAAAQEAVPVLDGEGDGH
ncbi:MAG: prolyl oligopeptidase family serine peptidase [Bacteroidetes bacterium]|jgi:dipeptidyl aminopeptidase/acylaminoacyl peptidase|nr:prolyl oligopeptidase family serine peptidase [Bacteroidota bacterium]